MKIFQFKVRKRFLEAMLALMVIFLFIWGLAIHHNYVMWESPYMHTTKQLLSFLWEDLKSLWLW